MGSPDRVWPAWWCIAWLACALPGAVLAASAPAEPTPKQAAAQKKLDHVRAEIKTLAAQQRTTGDQRDTLQAKLAKQAETLASAGKAVAAARAAVDEKRAALKDLQTQRSRLQAKLDDQREALAELLRATYTLGHGNDLRMLLGQWSQCDAAQPATATSSSGVDSCTSGAQALARIDRALAYSRYFQHDRVQRIYALLGGLARLHQVEASIATEQKALQATLDERNQRADDLHQQRHAQAGLLVSAEAQLKQQGQRLEILKRDEKSLQTLIVRLRDVFADLPRELPGEAPFASLRGQLRWPVRGKSSSHNQGVLLSAQPGTPVHAVAHGRVVYAAWLRGYGMLLIVDQADGWMTLYGGNETLLQDVGDWVDAGAEIATSGQGEAGKAGLYFGLRHHGKAVNPRPWLASKP